MKFILICQTFINNVLSRKEGLRYRISWRMSVWLFVILIKLCSILWTILNYWPRWSELSRRVRTVLPDCLIFLLSVCARSPHGGSWLCLVTVTTHSPSPPVTPRVMSPSVSLSLAVLLQLCLLSPSLARRGGGRVGGRFGGFSGSRSGGSRWRDDVTPVSDWRRMFRSSWGSSRGSASPSRTSASRFNSYSGGRGRSTSSGGFGLGLGGGLLLGYSLSRPGYGPGYGYGYGNNYNYQRRNNYDTTRSVSLWDE